MAAPLDYRQMALTAGLESPEADQFESGLQGKHDEAIQIPTREVYDALQRIIEEGEAELLQTEGEDPFRFFYLTTRLLTPFYRRDHPRFDVVGRLFDARTHRSMGCSVSTMAGFEQLKEEIESEDRAEEDLITRIVNNIPRQREGLPSICLTPRNWSTVETAKVPAVNYMAAPETAYRTALAFHAPQGGPLALSSSPGTVYFGPIAQGMAGTVFREWRANAQRWGSHNILKMLGQEGL